MKGTDGAIIAIITPKNDDSMSKRTVFTIISLQVDAKTKIHFKLTL